MIYVILPALIVSWGLLGYLWWSSVMKKGGRIR